MMNVFLTVLEIVAPVILIASIGFSWIKKGWEYPTQFITNLVMTVSMPALMFISLVNTEIDPKAIANIFIAAITCYLILTVIIFLVVKILSLELKTYWQPLLFSNTGNLGMPLALFAFGELGFDYALLVFAVMAIYAYSVGVWMFSGGGSFLTIFKEPVVLATILGAVFMVQGWKVPTFLNNALELLGQIVVPLMLLTLGAALAKLSAPTYGRFVWLTLLKFILCTATAFTIGSWLDLEPIALSVLTLQFATPVAVTSYLLAQKYGANAEDVAGLVVVSTSLSVILLPLLIILLL